MTNQKSTLTSQQLLIWLGQKLQPDLPIYNVAFTFTFHQKLDADRFNHAFNKLLKTHPSLRTFFIEQKDKPVQYVADYQPEKMKVLEIEGLTDDEVNNWLDQRVQQKFDLEKRCYDSVLLQGENKTIWFFNLHHIITDAWSFTIYFKDLKSFYFQEETEPESYRFEEYIKFELNQDNGKTVQYWEKQAEPVKRIELFPLQSGKDSTSTRVHINLGEGLTEKLTLLAENPDFKTLTKELSLYQLFMTAIFSVIYKISSTRDLRIGTPIHSRIKPSFKKTTGLFLDFFPVNIRIEKDESFKSLQKKVQNQVFELLKHAKPGAANAKIRSSFNIVLNYANQSFGSFNGISFTSKWLSNGYIDQTDQVRVQVHDFDGTGNFHLCIDFNDQYFSEQNRLDFISYLTNTLEELSLRPSKSLIDLQLHEDIENILSYTFEPIKGNILESFLQQVDSNPHAIALKHENKELTYTQLLEQASHVAAFLQAKGVNPQEKVILQLPRSMEYVSAFFGILLNNNCAVPVPVSAPPARAEYIKQTTEAAISIDSHAMKEINDQGLSTLDKQEIRSEDSMYVIFTSGSTGKPKGVEITHQSFANYIFWANDYYLNKQPVHSPLFTSVGFDLTLTSLFLPLISGGSCTIYPETDLGEIVDLKSVFNNQELNLIKATPTHLQLVKNRILPGSNVKVLIVGGESFPTNLAAELQDHYGEDLAIYNEYGPTEAAVGCIIHKFDITNDKSGDVPIGKPIRNMHAVLLNEDQQPVLANTTGEIYMLGHGVAKGYLNNDLLSKEKFISHTLFPKQILYKTGDYARINEEGQLVYLGRKDDQVKLNGYRIELGEIETAVAKVTESTQTVAMVWDNDIRNKAENLFYCTSCGLPSNYPSISYNSEGVCSLCQNFDNYQSQVSHYFRTMDDLRELISSRKRSDSEYDCIMLLSGGKDSTYALAKLKELGFRVLAYNFDNGFISEEALDNARKICNDLDVDLLIDSTDAMNEIFVDSLQRHNNVCNGCFKAIYTLSTHVALEKNIPIIVTGLSRGQFFETRLSEELFKSNTSIKNIDEIILEARKEYHRIDDAVSEHLDVSIFEYDDVFEKVEFVDFYRFCDSSLAEMYTYLDETLGWKRPTDTGRSTNCLINQLGIYVHKKKEGYSNYAFPYSWDVRIGHKTREESIDEINEEIDETEVFKMMDEIGYDFDPSHLTKGIVVYYTGKRFDDEKLQNELSTLLPGYMIPNRFIHVEEIPVTANGKVDKAKLPDPNSQFTNTSTYQAPRNDLETMISLTWQEVLQVNEIGVFDNFLALGGNSLAAIRITSRMEEKLGLEIPLRELFEHPTIAGYSDSIANIIQSKLN
ncbi:amino acid adenylation domain-containing protein [Rhodohalobacter sulfatireducens]|uniref:Amino acid adenylation domain-containing protein n=1 Tax=Rhodohalobacter sulfatireducens TaxID=2911366 RepID=A0ABS9KIY4_9BACT|nr:amino acid adenylation domain-containing protein [Rhodohalobacter sulfatireducens]MCG2590806.1 amino acid adenylation domain-containing protein [Rhodohalobacter sulfatireducens]